MSEARPSPDQRSDADLIAASQSGETTAFDELVTRYQDRVYNLAYRLIGNHDDAAELAQESFLKAYRSLSTFRGDCAFYTWMFRITVNTVRSRQRFRAVRPSEIALSPGTGENDNNPRPSRMADRFEADGPDPVEEASRAETQRLVEQAISRLNVEQRMLITLRDIEGRDYAEIGDVLDCPRGTVKSRLHRARMALKALLAPVLADQFGAMG